LATDPPSQRVYRASCPHCGAPVEFRSAASTSAVCSYCHSTLVRDGDALRRIGVSAELFDDHSPLRLGAAGRLQGEAFTLVGRLQYGYDEGTWNEWHALFDNGRSGWLSEDNGRYVFAFDAPLQGEAPVATELVAGERRLVDGRAWSVASVTQAKLLAAEGELSRPPRLQGAFTVADLRDEQGEVGTLDYSEPATPQWSVGRSVALAELAMSGLAEASEKTLKGAGLSCPNCGAAIALTLDNAQSVVCGQCHAVVDLSKGIGGDLAYYRQANTGEADQQAPQLPLGSVGTLALGGPAQPWQVVGYQERCDIPEDADDEQSFWREYLLYHRTAGFAFLVDAEDGWSWVVPLTGAPQLRGDRASWQGAEYRKLYSYQAKTTYVLGEFYWRVERDQRSFNTDFTGIGNARNKRLNREMSAGAAAPGRPRQGPTLSEGRSPSPAGGAPQDAEVVWSGGETLDAATVAAAFRLPPAQQAALRRAAAAPSPPGFSPLVKVLIVIALLLLVMWLVSRCSRDDCAPLRDNFGAASNEYQQCVRSHHAVSGYRTWGGSYGGFSSGGGHK
jgi:hypothetical protein